MSGPSRYCYSHGIPGRKTDFTPKGELVKRGRRISLTFRKIRVDLCNCKWKTLCDSQDGILKKTRLK